MRIWGQAGNYLRQPRAKLFPLFPTALTALFAFSSFAFALVSASFM